MNNQPIHEAVMKNQLKKLKNYLKEGVDINLQGEYACTPLHYACQNGNLEMVTLLIKNGANVNMKNRYATYYPLFDVLSSTDTENIEAIVKLLIESGANINIVDSFGSSLLHYAVEKESMLLIDAFLTLGCDINQTQRHDKDTALHYAYFQNNEEIISRLIKAGAKVDALNIYGKTAINYLEVVV